MGRVWSCNHLLLILLILLQALTSELSPSLGQVSLSHIVCGMSVNIIIQKYMYYTMPSITQMNTLQ